MTKTAFKTRCGGSRVVDEDGKEVKPSKKKVTKKTGTSDKKGKDNVSKS